MAGIDLKGLDPWPNISAGAELAAPSAVLGAVGGDWLGVGLKLLGGGGLFGSSKTSQSGAASTSNTALNTSGWVIGEGDAQGGSLSTDTPTLANVPWWGWAVFTLVGVAIIKKANK